MGGHSDYLHRTPKSLAMLLGTRLGLFSYHYKLQGDRGDTVVKVLCYKSEGRWFDPSWCHPSGRTMALGSTQSLTEYQEYFLGVVAAGA